MMKIFEKLSELHICDLTRLKGLKCVSILPAPMNRVKSLLCALYDYVSILVPPMKNKIVKK